MTTHILSSENEIITNDYSSSHKAVDVVGEGHTVSDVIAYSDGVVELVVSNVKYTDHNTSGTATYGNFVKIRHSDGTKTLYAHLEYGSVTVAQGQSVSKGQVIGRMGATGNAYGIHLHFEIRAPDETRLNPNDYLYKSVSEEVVVSETSVSNSVDDTSSEEISEESSISGNEGSEEITPTEEASSEEVTYETEDTSYLHAKSYSDGSIVDGLKSIDVDSSYEHREEIAYDNGITNYTGSYSQNVYLLKLLKQGKLKA